jgi:hypothetical protein
MKRRTRLIIIHLAIIIASAVYVFVVRTCPFRAITGIPCPFCGLTSAWLAVLQGDLINAFSYHPLFLFIPALLMFAFHYKLLKINEKWGNTIIIAGAVIIFTVYIIRITSETII